MNLIRQTKRSGVYILWLLIVSFTVSCGASEAPESTTTEITPTAPPAQPVEYGASLSEWEEATQTDLEQVENSDVMNASVEEAQATATIPIAPTESVNSVSATETDTADSTQATATVPIVPTESVNAVSSTETDAATSTQGAATTSLFTLNDIAYQEIMWDSLVPADFTAEAIMSKYEDQLAQFDDGSPEAFDLYTQMQEEFNNAPINDLMDGTLVRLPGFIAPLEYTNDLITEFLLVPYFGACIHVPPPPANQTVLVKTAEGQGIKSEDAYIPFWVMGELTAEGATTELAEAGYYVENAVVEPYSDSP